MIAAMEYAHSETDLCASLLRRSNHPLQQRVRILRMRKINHKGVRITAAGNADVSIQQRLDLPCERTQHIVAESTSVKLIHQVKAVDIEHNRIHRDIRVVKVIGRAVFMKIFAGIQTRKHIRFRCVDDNAVLSKRN